jgi:phosphoribosylamine--glycine ligase
MKVLIVGSGGREHAIAWKLATSPGVTGLYCAPGNPGIAPYAECVPIGAGQLDRIVRFAQDQRVGLVVVGPEDPLAAGLVDRLAEVGVRAFGPSRAAAQIEADKWFAKELMRHQAVPTAEARAFTDPNVAAEYVRARDEPCVVKAAGLAKGKGVSVCYRAADALEAVNRIMKQRAFGDAGGRVVIEELLRGPECSVLALVSGRTLYLLEPAQDHKPVDDGDTGPMTGGMGAYSPTPIMTEAILRQVERDIFIPVLDGFAREGIEYRGVLYAGLMLTGNGPKVLEFNCRFGDPEAQPLLMRLQSDLLDVMLAVTEDRLDSVELAWDRQAAVCVVASSKGYPGAYETGLPITGIEAADSIEGVKVFHSGTVRRDGQLVTDGGRVLAVTALGEDVAAAQRAAYASMKKIHFDGMHYRRDIAHQAVRGASSEAG